ncbi:MAG: exodeoxyribonuclease VII large subunit [Zetaproteobacteria bacterium]|nr:MAG: exodeoxyribonuclease VII large subunit [Zetaproteobacteria bacterium]
MLNVPSQKQPLSVSELTVCIKQVLEQGFSSVRVLGEISRLNRQASGHMYFTIKDEGATLSAVIWKSATQRLTQLPEEGQQYIFTGHISLYPPQGRYQLIVSHLETAGSGALAIEFERRKKEFSERGWFAPETKRPVPSLPRHIGIVTSETAAALQDVKKVLSTRPGWLQLTLSPTLVQGTAAASQIARALKRLQCMQDKPDVILLVRGGGSPEDLWCFNEEVVVHAIAECDIPVITGIGHEIDISLADFAADKQAATPSNAAEIACPDRETLRKQMPRIALLQQLMRHLLADAQKSLNNQNIRLQHVWTRTHDAWRMHVERQHQSLCLLTSQQIQLARQRFEQEQGRLAALNPIAVLKRGYSVSYGPDGQILTHAARVKPGDAVRVHFQDGDVHTQVKSVDALS